MKRTITIIVSLCVCLAGYAQGRFHHDMPDNRRFLIPDPIVNEVGIIEFEAAVGLTGGCQYEYSVPKAGIQGLLELRGNFPGLPYDIALQGSIANFNREAESWGMQGYSRNKGAIVGFFDYNIRGHMGVDAFIGIGIGSAACEYARPENKTDDIIALKTTEKSKLVLNPRLGVEIVSRVRLTAEYKFMADSRFSYAAFNIGYTIGGGPRYYVERRW